MSEYGLSNVVIFTCYITSLFFANHVGISKNKDQAPTLTCIFYDWYKSHVNLILTNTKNHNTVLFVLLFHTSY
jgi:hypothetical protein